MASEALAGANDCDSSAQISFVPELMNHRERSVTNLVGDLN